MPKKYTSDTQEILELVRFLKDNAATQESVDHLEKRINEINYDLRVYIDEKLSDYTSDIFKRLDKKYKQDVQFKEKVVELFSKHKIGAAPPPRIRLLPAGPGSWKLISTPPRKMF
ncbi:MAG: hypothetical protein HY983_04325 [Candidatus Magasanikbacteria bacterium]|nr:hypothetical protein [Candidatus Magasanikbacteria bacterium]